MLRLLLFIYFFSNCVEKKLQNIIWAQRATNLDFRTKCRGRAASNLPFIMFDQIWDFGGESRCHGSVQLNREASSVTGASASHLASLEVFGTQSHHLAIILTTNCCTKGVHRQKAIQNYILDSCTTITANLLQLNSYKNPHPLLLSPVFLTKQNTARAQVKPALL